MWGQETWTILLAGVISAIAASAVAWFLRKREFEPEDVTIGFIGPSLAAMYLLVLALSLATEWQTISSAQQAVGNEAVAARQVYWAASGLPEPAAGDLESQVRGYLSTVIHHDWPQMERGTLDNRSDQLLSTMGTFVLRINTTTSGASNAQQYRRTTAPARSALFHDQGNSFLPSRSKVVPVISVVILMIVVLIPCAAAAVTRYGRVK
jgi:hypothetical protein